MKYKWIVLPIIAVVAALIQACGQQKPPAQQGCNFVQNSALQRVSWANSAPVELYVHQSVPDIYTSALEAAVAKWNQVAGRDILRLVPGRVSGASAPQKDGYSVIYMMNTWETDRRQEQARTTIYWSGDSIYEADVRLNDKFFDFSVDKPENQFSGVDMESLLIHEFGHVLGLSHTNSVGSVMYKSLASGDVRDQISQSDRDALLCEY